MQALKGANSKETFIWRQQNIAMNRKPKSRYLSAKVIKRSKLSKPRKSTWVLLSFEKLCKLLNKLTWREGSFGADKKLWWTESWTAEISMQNFLNSQSRVNSGGVLEAYLGLNNVLQKWKGMQPSMKDSFSAFKNHNKRHLNLKYIMYVK